MLLISYLILKKINYIYLEISYVKLTLGFLAFTLIEPLFFLKRIFIAKFNYLTFP
jgi:hypothetical protein